MRFAVPQQKQEVRFIREPTFRELVSVVRKPEHQALLWLVFDVGENASSLLQLTIRDVSRHVNSETNQAEYYVNLRREILKRSRRPRTEITNYPETAQILDLILRNRPPGEPMFAFGPRMAKKVLDRAVRISWCDLIRTGLALS